jgi:hypothetical protein
MFDGIANRVRRPDVHLEFGGNTHSDGKPTNSAVFSHLHMRFQEQQRKNECPNANKYGWTIHVVFSLVCKQDVTLPKVRNYKACVASLTNVGPRQTPGGVMTGTPLI